MVPRSTISASTRLSSIASWPRICATPTAWPRRPATGWPPVGPGVGSGPWCTAGRRPAAGGPPVRLRGEDPPVERGVVGDQDPPVDQLREVAVPAGADSIHDLDVVRHTVSPAAPRPQRDIGRHLRQQPMRRRHIRRVPIEDPRPADARPGKAERAAGSWSICRPGSDPETRTPPRPAHPGQARRGPPRARERLVKPAARDEVVEADQSYPPDTGVVVTTARTVTGVLSVTDAFLCARVYPPSPCGQVAARDRASTPLCSASVVLAHRRHGSTARMRPPRPRINQPRVGHGCRIRPVRQQPGWSIGSRDRRAPNRPLWTSRRLRLRGSPHVGALIRCVPPGTPHPNPAD
jgi:hypothetical protein